MVDKMGRLLNFVDVSIWLLENVGIVLIVFGKDFDGIILILKVIVS